MRPLSGDVAAVLGVSSRFARVEDEAEGITDQLRLIGTGTGEEVWRGEAADVFRERVAALLPDLAKMVASYGAAGAAMRVYADALDDAQNQHRRASDDAGAAGQDKVRAESERDSARGEEKRSSAAAATADRALLDSRSRPVDPLADPAYLAQLAAWERDVEVRRDAARGQADAARQRRSAADGRVSAAEARLAAATLLAGQAEELRDDAAAVAVAALGRAGAAGIRNRGLVESVRTSVTDRLGGACDRVTDTVGDVAGAAADVLRSEGFQRVMEQLDDYGTTLTSVGTVVSVVGMGVAVVFPPAGGAIVAVGRAATVAGLVLTSVAFVGTTASALAGGADAGDVFARGVSVASSALAVLAVPKMAGMVNRAANYSGAGTTVLRDFATAAPVGGAAARKLAERGVAEGVVYAAGTSTAVVTAGYNALLDGRDAYDNLTGRRDPDRSRVADAVDNLGAIVVGETAGPLGETWGAPVGEAAEEVVANTTKRLLKARSQ